MARRTVRLALTQIGQMITVGEHDRPAGIAGDLIEESSSWFSKIFNYTYVWVPFEDQSIMGYRKPDGTYTGVMKLLAEDRADMCLLPLPFVPEVDAFETGPSLISSSTVITSILDIRAQDDNVLKQLFRFSGEIIVLLAASVYVLSFVLTRTERTRNVSTEEESLLRSADTKFLGSMWNLLQLMALQANYCPKTLPGKVLIVVTSVGVFFWYAIWGNLMTSDTVSYDTDNTINNLDDVFRLNTSLYLVSSDPIVTLLEVEAEAEPDSPVGKMMHNYSYIWRQTENSKLANPGVEKTEEFKKQFSQINDTVLMNKAIVTSKIIIDQAEGMLCKYRDQNPKKWNHKLQHATDNRLPYVPFSPWLSRKLDPVLRSGTVTVARKVAESGLMAKVYSGSSGLLNQMFQITSKGSCIVASADRYIQDMMMSSDDVGIYVSVHRVYDVFVLYCACMVISVVFLIIEKSRIWDSVAERFHLTMEELQQRRVERRMMKKERKELFSRVNKKMDAKVEEDFLEDVF